jgi:hypothetical protein
MPPKPQTKQERLAAALRENLKRRKAGARAAKAEPSPGASPDAPERPNTAKKLD